MYGFHSAFTIYPAFPERNPHSFISFYFYTLTEKGGLKAAFSCVQTDECDTMPPGVLR